MKLLFDYFPILLFFVAFKIYGIYVATLITMGASLLQVGIYWLKHRKFETLHIVTLVSVLLLGGLTVILHDDMFIKWKPTVVFWLFSLVFLGSAFIGKKTLIQRMMDSKIQLPKHVWSMLNISWVSFFALMGGINLYVVYHFSTDAWVNFKLFGSLGLTIVFIVLQALFMARYIKEDKELDSNG